MKSPESPSVESTPSRRLLTETLIRNLDRFPQLYSRSHKEIEQAQEHIAELFDSIIDSTVDEVRLVPQEQMGEALVTICDDFMHMLGPRADQRERETLYLSVALKLLEESKQ